MISLRPRSIDFKSSWETNCRRQLQSLFNHQENNSSEREELSAVQLYSSIYELCISFPENHSMTLLQNIAQLFFDSAVKIRQNILGTIQTDSMDSKVLLARYVLEWKKYREAFKGIDGVCRYLNKCLKANYETAQYPASPRDSETHGSHGLHFQPVLIKLTGDQNEKVELRVIGIEDVAKSVWNNLILRYFREISDNPLTKGFLIELRLENAIESDLKSFIESYSWCDDSSIIEMIELDTKDYYLKLSKKFIEDNSTAAYATFAIEKLNLEIERTNRLWIFNNSFNFLETAAEAKKIIMRTCEIELIENHKSKLQEEFEFMLLSGNTLELTLLYKLLGRNEGTTLALQQSLSNLILKEFEGFENENENVNVNQEKEIDKKNNNTHSQIFKLLNIYQKYTKLIKIAFNDESKISKTLNESIGIIINTKIVNCWLLFSNFIDEILGKKEFLSVEVLGLIKLFTIQLDSFDNFIKDYKEKLAERIILKKINSKWEEKVLNIFSVTDKLSSEQNCHLKRMLLDFKESQLIEQDEPKEKNKSKAQTQAQAQVHKHDVLVLTSHAWPSSCNPPMETTDDLSTKHYPESLKSLIKDFEGKYCEKHSGRKLNWCPQLITLQTENDTKMTLLQYQIISSLPANEEDLAVLCGTLPVNPKAISRSLKLLLDNGIVKFEIQSKTFEFIELPKNLNLISENDLIGRNLNHNDEDLNSNDVKEIIQQTALEIDSSRRAKDAYLLQSLCSSILKRQRQASPAELKKLLITATGKLKHGHAFCPRVEEIEASVRGLVDKGYLEFSEHENLYIYVP